ncbi:MAG: type II toxin-antitoxin system YafQ family toxin [Candidatus Melainabacteria bacterium]|nr:type II toxin-antitoxin system YafQ family toxin [Candidatus Melainabacteria bacterium]
MRSISKTKKFRKDQKREKKGARKDTLELDLADLVTLLATDALLPDRYQDHPLSGEWKDHRDAHLLPDLLLIYRKVGDDNLELVRLGSHSELGL